MNRRALLLSAASLLAPRALAAQTPSPVETLLAAARAQIGVTTIYDPAYQRLPFPGGDPPRGRGVCTDVIIRAFRDAFGLDLQKEVNADMRAAFAAYPKRWGLTRPDSSIDHRRVPNLQVFFTRRGRTLPVSTQAVDYQPGDMVTQLLPGALPHIAFVAQEKSREGRPLLIHNIGAGARMEDGLFTYPVTGRYRFGPLA